MTEEAWSGSPLPNKLGLPSSPSCFAGWLLSISHVFFVLATQNNGCSLNPPVLPTSMPLCVLFLNPQDQIPKFGNPMLNQLLRRLKSLGNAHVLPSLSPPLDSELSEGRECGIVIPEPQNLPVCLTLIRILADKWMAQSPLSSYFYQTHLLNPSWLLTESVHYTEFWQFHWHHKNPSVVKIWAF